MEDENRLAEELLCALRAEVAKLLSANDITEKEKLARIKLAQQILEKEDM